MTRRLYVWNSAEQKMVEIYNSDTYVEKPRPSASASVFDDTISVESPLTGEVYTSKSALKAHYKAHGYEMTGGDHLGRKPPEPYKVDMQELRDTVAKSLNDLRWGNVPVSEKERELCKREERNYQEYKRRMS